jgi:Ca2+-binding EF-hand superfamily protein
MCQHGVDSMVLWLSRMDNSGNHKLSLAEIDKAVVELWPHFDHKRALMRAYKAADSDNDGYVERREFKKLLQ